MKIEIDDNLMSIFKEIISENQTDEEWALIESDDMFQCGQYVGGYDAIEEAFCFSYYDPNKKEYWFQLTLDEIKGIVNGKKIEIRAREAEV